MLFLQKPRYYDAPDGQAPVDKLVSMTKKGFIAGIVAGTWDCIYITDTKNAIETLNTLAYWIVPFVGISATWASVTYAATKIRGKDERLNYAIGAAACAPILHAWRKSTPYTFGGTAFLIGAAVLAKDANIVGWQPLPPVRHIYGNYAWDMTLIKDPGKDIDRRPNQYW